MGAPQPQPAPAKKEAGKKKDEAPLYLRSPFAKQTNRTQAIMGKLLEDNTMVRVLKSADGSATDIVYYPKFEAQAHSRNLGAARAFGSQVGRNAKVGTRAAAAGTRPSHWYPTSPPKDEVTRPCSAGCIPFAKQITRKQDVNGKLLENIESGQGRTWCTPTPCTFH